MLILQVGVFCCITHFNLYRKVVTRPPSGGISLRFQTRLNLNPFLLLLVESPLLLNAYMWVWFALRHAAQNSTER